MMTQSKVSAGRARETGGNGARPSNDRYAMMAKPEHKFEEGKAVLFDRTVCENEKSATLHVSRKEEDERTKS